MDTIMKVLRGFFEAKALTFVVEKNDWYAISDPRIPDRKSKVVAKIFVVDEGERPFIRLVSCEKENRAWVYSWIEEILFVLNGVVAVIIFES